MGEAATESDYMGAGSARRNTSSSASYVLTELLMIARFGPPEAREAAGLQAVAGQTDDLQLHYMAQDGQLSDRVRDAALLKYFCHLIDTGSSSSVVVQLREPETPWRVEENKAPFLEVLGRVVESLEPQNYAYLKAIQNPELRSHAVAILGEKAAESDAQPVAQLQNGQLVLVADWHSSLDRRREATRALIEKHSLEGRWWAIRDMDLTAFPELTEGIPRALQTACETAIRNATEDGNYDVLPTMGISDRIPEALRTQAREAIPGAVRNAIARAVGQKDADALHKILSDRKLPLPPPQRLEAELALWGIVTEKGNLQWLGAMAAPPLPDSYLPETQVAALEQLMRLGTEAARGRNLIDDDMRARYLETVGAEARRRRVEMQSSPSSRTRTGRIPR